jgi:hypothetical protein
MKLKPLNSLPTLQKGQLWKTPKARVEIVHMGKLLVHYRYFVDGKTRANTTMSPVQAIQEHLKANGGKLMKNDRLTVSI